MSAEESLRCSCTKIDAVDLANSFDALLMITEIPNAGTEPSKHVFFCLFFFPPPGYAAELANVINGSFSRRLVFVGYLSGPSLCGLIRLFHDTVDVCVCAGRGDERLCLTLLLYRCSRL